MSLTDIKGGFDRIRDPFPRTFLKFYPVDDYFYGVLFLFVKFDLILFILELLDFSVYPGPNEPRPFGRLRVFSGVHPSSL